MAGDKGLETLLVWQKSLAFTVEVCKNILPKLSVQENGRWSISYGVRRKVFLQILLKVTEDFIFKRVSAFATLREVLLKKPLVI